MARKKVTDEELKKLEHELTEELKSHILKEEEIRISLFDNEYQKYYEGVKKGKNSKIVYNIDGDATKTNYTKNKKTITTYDEIGKELIRTYLSKTSKDKKKKNNVRTVKSVKELSNINTINIYERLKAFIKHDRMLNDIIIDKKDGISKAISATGMYIKSPSYIPIAISIYSLALNIESQKLVNEIKKNRVFMSVLEKSGYYDMVMSQIDKSYIPELEETQVITVLPERVR